MVPKVFENRIIRLRSTHENPSANELPPTDHGL